MTSQELLHLFQLAHPASDQYSALSEFLGSATPAQIVAFALGVLNDLPEGGPFFDITLSHLSDDDLAIVLDQAVQMLIDDVQCEASDSVVAQAGLLLPQVVRPHLASLFALDEVEDSVCAERPWRSAGPDEITFLGDKLVCGNPQERLRARRCLIATRQADAVKLVLQSGAWRDACDDEALLGDAGFSALGIPLWCDDVYHLIFPAGHVHQIADSVPQHPTRSLIPVGADLPFGGAGTAECGVCGVCGGTLHHLLTLPEQHVFAADATGLTALEVCLSCLGWEKPVLFYTHGGDGLPRSEGNGAVTPRFPAGALQAATVQLAPTPRRWHTQDWGRNRHENLHRVGGHPSWIQYPNYPACPHCAAPMRFILQLDSALPAQDGETWLWGSGGMLYGFGCTPCRTTGYLWQST